MCHVCSNNLYTVGLSQRYNTKPAALLPSPLQVLGYYSQFATAAFRLLPLLIMTG